MRFGALVSLTLCLAAAMGVVVSGAEARQDPGAQQTETTESAVIGASVVNPESWIVERERFTYGGTYGFTLWRSDTDAPHDHGGTQALRVALAYDLEPAQIEDRVEDRISEFPDLPVEREEVAVAARHEGTAVGPIPGSIPSTEVYVPVSGRVYRINVYASEPGEEGLDEGDRRLLSSLRFEQPARSIESLDLPRANAPETLYASGASGPTRPQQRSPETSSDTDPEVTAQRGDDKIKEGCYRADPGYYFRLQYDRRANSNSGDKIRTGFSLVGMPNYWDEYTHGDLGYGRCKEPDWCNDKFAVDYPLNRGDLLYSPFENGTVTFAGRNRSHSDYGILVSIRASNGKYVSLSAHLDRLADGIRDGAKVTDETVIGYAGDTGGSDIPVGRPHLHQAFYRYPKYMPDGSPYGGRGLQVVRKRYLHGDGGSYRFDWKHSRKTKAKGDSIRY